MDHIEKLFRKLNKKDRDSLLEISENLQKDSKIFFKQVIKIKGTDFYRLRKGRFRIIFHYEGKVVIIDSIRLRNEKTYRNLE